MRTRQTKKASDTENDTRYYEFEGLPAYRKASEVPMIVHPKKVTPCYDFETFSREASPITKEQFEALKKG